MLQQQQQQQQQIQQHQVQGQLQRQQQMQQQHQQQQQGWFNKFIIKRQGKFNWHKLAYSFYVVFYF